MVSMENNVKEISHDVAVSLWKKAMLSVETECERQPEVIMVKGVCIATLGNFSASTGKAKSKKTFNLSAIVAAALCDHPVLCYTASFPENKGNILYVDTEQSTYHCQKVMKRILRLAGLPEDKDCSRLQFLALRKNTPEERLAIIDVAIRSTEHLGLVIIDGVRDLIHDINSPAESSRVISKLMQWTDEYQLHLHTILHQNKSDDNARGHVGTELNNKAETVMQVEKDKVDSCVSVVEAVHIRSMDFEPFAFRINDDAMPELVVGYTPSAASVGRPKKEPFDPYREIPAQIHLNVLERVFAASPSYDYDGFCHALQDAYLEEGVKINYNKAVSVVTFLRNKRMVLQDDKRKYIANPEAHY